MTTGVARQRIYSLTILAKAAQQNVMQTEHKKSPDVNDNCKIIYQSHQAGVCE